MPKNKKKSEEDKPKPSMLGSGLAEKAGIKLGGRSEQIEAAVMGTVTEDKDKKKKKKQ